MPTNDFEQLQSVVRRLHNRIVRDDFRDDIQDDDLQTPEGALRYACLVKENDSAQMMCMRFWVFYLMREYGSRLHPAMYIHPVEDYQESVQFKPQLVMWFWEPQAEAKLRNKPAKRVRVSFRLVKETSETISQVDIDGLKSRVKTEFPKSYRFKTGRYKASYRDKPNGIELILAPYDEGQAKTMVEKVLNIAQVRTDWTNFSISTHPDRNYTQQEYVQILGERKKLPSKRPITNVYLKKAELHIHGLTESVPIFESYVR